MRRISFAVYKHANQQREVNIGVQTAISTPSIGSFQESTSFQPPSNAQLSV